MVLLHGGAPSSASCMVSSFGLFIPALTVGNPPRPVYLCWYPDLKGLEGWFADSLEELSDFVTAGVRSTACFGRVCSFGDSHHPFVLDSSGRSFHCFSLERFV